MLHGIVILYYEGFSSGPIPPDGDARITDDDIERITDDNETRIID